MQLRTSEKRKDGEGEPITKNPSCYPRQTGNRAAFNTSAHFPPCVRALLQHKHSVTAHTHTLLEHTHSVTAHTLFYSTHTLCSYVCPSLRVPHLPPVATHLCPLHLAPFKSLPLLSPSSPSPLLSPSSSSPLLSPSSPSPSALFPPSHVPSIFPVAHSV